jgi:hypothetical protein
VEAAEGVCERVGVSGVNFAHAVTIGGFVSTAVNLNTVFAAVFVGVFYGVGSVPPSRPQNHLCILSLLLLRQDSHRGNKQQAISGSRYVACAFIPKRADP